MPPKKKDFDPAKGDKDKKDKEMMDEDDFGFDKKDKNKDKGDKMEKLEKMDKMEKMDKLDKMTKKDKEKVLKGKEKVLKTVRKKKKVKLASRSFTTYIHRVVKRYCSLPTGEEHYRLSSKSMEILDSFAHDLFDRLIDEGTKLLRLTGRKTLTSLEIQTAARLILPGAMSKYAETQGTRAIQKFNSMRKQQYE